MLFQSATSIGKQLVSADLVQLAGVRQRAHLLEVGGRCCAQHADVVVVVVRYKHATVGQQREVIGAVKLRLHRSAIPVPRLAVARYRAHLLQVGAQHADAVVSVVRHQHAAVRQHR
jgi:hypothetical protein